MGFRRRFGNSLRPVNRIKHVYDNQFAGIAGTGNHLQVIKTVDQPDTTVKEEVQTGCTINGVFVIFEANATSSAALANFYFILWKSPSNNIVAITPNTVGVSDDRRLVLHQEMVMFQQQTNSNPRTVFKGVVVIPKHMRRFGINDVLYISTLAPGVNTFQCTQVHWKEFR